MQEMVYGTNQKCAKVFLEYSICSSSYNLGTLDIYVIKTFSIGFFEIVIFIKYFLIETHNIWGLARAQHDIKVLKVKLINY